LLKPVLVVAGLALSVAALATPPVSASVRGAYLEARTADLYTGRCSGEAHGDGRAAILAWHIDDGDLGGVPLAGLAVVAVVRSEVSLSNGSAAAASRSLILVDEGASPAQRHALEAFVRAEAGRVLGQVVGVEAMPIEIAVDPSRALGRLHVGDLADLRTRPFNRLDALCGDETVTSAPLAEGVEATPAVALEHAFHSDALGSSWDAVNGRGAFVGTFVR
jgi:hypothetical protein